MKFPVVSPPDSPRDFLMHEAQEVDSFGTNEGLLGNNGQKSLIPESASGFHSKYMVKKLGVPN